MARMPATSWRPLTENTTAPRIHPTQVILHSAVGSGSLFNQFQKRSNLESHFWVGLDGLIEQYMDTDVMADANYHANRRAISIETADNGHPDSFPWTDAQVVALVSILRWAHHEHGIPLVRCHSWDSPGVGYHTMFGAPGQWTPVAKTCPGAARIAQFSDILHAAQDQPTNDDEGINPMITLQQIADAVWAKQITQAWNGENRSAAGVLSSAQFYAIQGGFPGTTPDTAGTSPGTPTQAASVAKAVEDAAAARALAEEVAGLVRKIAEKVGVEA